MRQELEEQSRQTQEAREKSKLQERVERKQNDAHHHEFRLATYSKLELSETEIAALEWIYNSPDYSANWEIYSALRQAYPVASKFISVLKSVTPDTDDTEWLKTRAFPGDDFEDFLEELHLLFEEHALWENRFKIMYDLKEQRRKKRSRFWWSILAIVILLILIISKSI